MEILTLIVKQKWFDQIMSGEKTEEYRETTLRTQRKFVQLDEDGSYVLELDEEGNAIPDFTGLGKPLPRQYDAIRFYVGYRADRDTALVKVNSIDVSWVLWGDDDGKEHPVIYGLTEEQQAAGEPFFIPLVLRYNLGEIIEKRVKEKK